VTITPGPLATAATRDQAELLQELSSTELERVRKAAENWQKGLAAIVALITTVSIVKGNDVITDLPSRWQWTVAGLLVAALVTAALGAYLAMRAAYGLPKPGPASEVRRWRREQAKEAISDLQGAIILTFTTLVFLALAVGFTWFGKEESSAGFLKVSTDSTDVCGSLKKADGSTLLITSGDSERDISVSAVRAMTVVSKCE
jgi:hypothetical protein